MFKPQQHHLQIERLILQNGGIAKRLDDGFYEQKLVHANNDLNNLGGTIDASNSLIASAGHDLNVISSTSTQSNATSSRTNISRVAGLYVTGDQGLLVASAGNDLHLDAAQIINNGKDSSTKLRAGHDLSIGTVASGQQSQITSNSKNKLSENSTQDHGSTIQTAGDISLQAGQDLNIKAATINSSQGSINVTAARNLTIATGQSTANSVGNTSYGYGTTNSTATATTQAISSLGAANNINLQSGADTHLTSVNLNAGKAIDIAATGNLTIDAVKDSSQLDYAYNAKNKRDIIHNQDETVIGSNINAGNNISLTATQAASVSAIPTTGGNITLNSVNITSQTGAVMLNADQDVTIGSTTESHSSYAEYYSRSKSLLSSKSHLTIIWERFIDRETGEVIFSFSMLTVNADGHPIMQHFHKPEDEKRSIIVLNEANYQPWLQANHVQARSLLKVAPDNFLISEAAPR